ncbi:MATE efflux family protein [Gottschalkia acidurici 9a]|uniref:Probable multidrug resistance protein NorM n=1 Tax=Gottschalkia acidurici (strain ATCC 7906 / DSM 604 / BCRC 14475 / CIP 104303 / KCTC 5404 / NCIMB 10678 / 9a) TaxID=1128398 RepID=K0AZC9_GOTA9|nr:MATE family efflux transporter [Gottschalkia acidurici]AFS78060.1 MATE efflux family protein [Gottschalkia acidurici 9a]
MQKVDLTKGKVSRVIFALTIPLVTSSLLQFMYNFIDMIWVGGLGSNAVASVGSSSLYVNIGYAISTMVVVGAGVKVSHAVGSKDDEGTNRYINTAFILNLFVGIIFSTIILIFGKTFINFLGIENLNVEKDSLSYLLISGSAMIIVFFNTLYIRIFSSFGNNKVSLIISSIGLIINIILDPIFIYTLNLGVNGAAIATVIANTIVLIMSIRVSKKLYELNFRKYFDFNMLKEIISLGLPSSIQRVIFTIINILIAKIIAIYGADALAAQKIGLQIESITFIIIGGFNGATASFIGQNYGAKRLDRISKGYNISILMGVIYTSIITVILLTIPELLASIFVKEQETIRITSDYLRIIGISQIFAAVEMITNGTFIGLGATRYAALISISLTIIRLPLALILSKLVGVNGIWWSIAISSILKGIISYSVYKFVLWRKLKNKFT